ncbi:Reverse transcriptase (RNA-dependent DNA polymerase) [Nesidiocoris tenuis]|uniref:Reverse transcriptase (RNA-dependent DNA polymerase) n=1 Tax=Nesidiocoris tenuis TaxID=355587 RepID=A0ABN7AE40_9HEMI|nr:Reverse transcriptase (RNA-dependent DNA polymerase) [Nesidiocoris tenuis]
MSLAQFDVSTAFLYGQVGEELYINQPEGFSDGSNKVCRLHRSLYGLKQAPRCWNKRFGGYMDSLGFKRSQQDSCFFIRKRNGNMILVALYVDDGLVATTDPQELQEFIKELKAEFKITVKDANFYLGIEINQKEDGSVTINQQNYIKKILQRFNMFECSPAPTPIIKDSTQSGGEDSNKEPVNFPYRQAVGALMYVMTATRPDIAYAVGVVARNLENPSNDDVVRVKRIFRYLKGSMSLGITYQPDLNKGVLKCFSDADHAGDQATGRSTTGVFCLYAGGAVTWLSQLQATVSISTTEAEIVAASEAGREIAWLKRFLSELVDIKAIPELQVDNEAAVRLAENPEFHRRTKHIRVRHFFIRELVNDGEVRVTKIPTEFQLADALTKPLAKPRLKSILEEIGLRSEIQKRFTKFISSIDNFQISWPKSQGVTSTKLFMFGCKFKNKIIRFTNS